MVAGGVLAPGGGKVEGTAVSPVSVFQCEPMVEAVRGHLVVSVLSSCLKSFHPYTSAGDDTSATEVQVSEERFGR